MIPTTVKELASDPAFWNAFHFWEEHEDRRQFPQLEGCVCRFEIAPRAALTLTLAPDFAYLSLSLESPELPQPVEIGWDDEAHFHPHVLRWSELESICAAVAAHEGEPHPGLALLLLSRFAPICLGDDVGFIVNRLAAAWKTVAPRVEATVVRRRVEALDRRQAGFAWTEHPAIGWVPTQPEFDLSNGLPRAILYSLRHPDNAQFPFREWKSFVAEAAHVRPGPPSAPSTIDLRTAHQIEISTKAPRTALLRLSKALSAAELGTAQELAGEGKMCSWILVKAWGDLDAALALIRKWVSDENAPPDTRIKSEGRLL